MNSLIRSGVGYFLSASKQNVRLLSNIATKPDFNKIVNNNKVVVFMKGVPEKPGCGFSNIVCRILKMHGVQFDAHNVLENEEIRNGIKEYSNWPTMPQIFIAGKFVGGCEILMKMHKGGDLIEELKKVGIESELLKQEKK
ncbi:unnamed protein product [Nezara viridula]|uniref:Glutaredoxin-related protein 5, mitochondrial n=1 Tax=Nezara viridula TaxID=85310 RepID=A0A9P0HJY3_NEZVI|nr:unnamed protein product [Nezara viridula]